MSLAHPPGEWEIEGTGLVTGSVVVSIDYFKRFLSGLRALVGGRMTSYETLLDRARREALVRLKERTVERGYHALVNVRMETSRMANARGGNSVAGIEVLAYGTALKLRDLPA